MWGRLVPWVREEIPVEVAVLLYAAMTVLDAMGPCEVLGQLPDTRLRFVAKSKGEIRNDTRFLGLIADDDFDSVPRADVLLIPGGPGDEWVRQDSATLEWIRQVHAEATWTTSVCTGSLILGAAGLLEGRRATTHWMRREALRDFGAEPVVARVVEDAGVMTAAGVSAGIDMALELVRRMLGDVAAQSIQLGIEYDPSPPFDAGSPEKAPEAVVGAMRAGFEAMMEQRLTDFSAAGR